jgi:formylglycine-generating enzyme required for sulfatase activity
MKLDWCPPGSFTMGSPKSERGHVDNEDQVSVTLTKGFWLGKYEVTQEEYVRIMGKNPSYFSAQGAGKNDVAGQDTERFPVESLRWEDAVEFCRVFTDQERQAGRLPAGWAYTLPTEAQWEYACRAGTADAFSFGNILNGREANCDGSHPYGTEAKGPDLARTTTVGSYRGNGWGLCDMHGNVSEYCRDKFATKLPGGTDPLVTSGEEGETNRGGSWHEHSLSCRSACRILALDIPHGEDLGEMGLALDGLLGTVAKLLSVDFRTKGFRLALTPSGD